ncbi:MAG: tRNA-modifying protein YgfZ, partial [Muribaculaceae bacterium]|nr:tRNA-modifying protein YgfZ [Muribaculaceae bacterium]
VDDRTIPHELDWMRSAVHLNKGCYRGQETVAKVHNLGHPPRRLVMLAEGANPSTSLLALT